MSSENGNGFPNQPWLPRAASVTLQYAATASLPGSGVAARFFHLLPFDGVAEVEEWPTMEASVPLLVTESPEELERVADGSPGAMPRKNLSYQLYEGQKERS